MSTATPTRVVVADDSRLMRTMLERELVAEGFDVVGTAADGDEALAVCSETAPDVLTLDLAMPGRDGMGVLRALQTERQPVNVVVVSAFSPAHGARAVDALAEGAVDLVAKPTAGEDVGAFVVELARKVRAAARSRRGVVAPRPAIAARRPPAAPVRPRPASGTKLVVVASSTGGPRALAELIPSLPATVGQGVLIVQHMPAGFTHSLAERLDRASKLAVREASDGDTLGAGTALIAPGGKHLRLRQTGKVSLTDEAPIGALRPRADLTITDAAALYGARLVLTVLTGMGRDGLDGALAVKRAGGRILVEDESTCTVYGMPRAVEEAGLADAVLPLHELAAAVAQEAR
jgi:two-component system chemotaxis response regulator CheB